MACTTASSQAKTPIQFSGTIDYGAARYVNGASTPIKNVLNGKLHDCIEDLVSTDKQLSGIIKMVDVDAQLDFNILTDIIPSYLDPSNAGQYGYEVMEDDYGAFAPMKTSQYAGTFKAGKTKRQRNILLGMYLAVMLAVFVFLFSRPSCALAVAWAGLVTILSCRAARKNLGGMSGDIAGFSITLGELSGLLILAVF